MKPLAAFGKHMFAALMCLSIVIWSVVPAGPHTPTVLKVIEDHLQMIADHGHSHGFEEDLFWAAHGHSHEAADHDHNQVLLALGLQTLPEIYSRDTLRARSALDGSHHNFKIERPPRV
jgi:hypothetical protein